MALRKNPFEGIKKGKIEVDDDLQYLMDDPTIKTYTDGKLHYEYKELVHLDLQSHGISLYVESLIELFDIRAEEMTPEEKEEAIQEIQSDDSMSPQDKSDRIAQINLDAEESEEEEETDSEEDIKRQREENDIARKALILKNLRRIYKIEEDGTEKDYKITPELIFNFHELKALELFTIFCGIEDAVAEAAEDFPVAGEEGTADSS